MILKTSETTEFSSRLGRGGVGVNGDSRVRYDESELDENELDIIEIDGSGVHGGKIRNNEVGKKDQKTSKSKNVSTSKKMVRSDFFTPGARLAFTKLRQTFVKALIFYYFDLEHYIRAEIDISGYAIDEIFSQLTLDNLGQ